MVILLQLIAIGLFILIGIQIFNSLRGTDGPSTRQISEQPSPSSVSPAGTAVAAFRALENVRADLRARYPVSFSMFGGYLNEHTMQEAGGVEGAVAEMVEDWSPRRDEVIAELTSMLNDNPDEEELRAIILAACDATFEDEGYRVWLSWLVDKFRTHQ